MKTIYYKADERGHANHGWLDAWHSFSFAGFHDPSKVHFGALRVLNDDKIAGGRGFGMHPHDNMEIVTIPLSGELEHEDSMGNLGSISKGEVQVMSAGTGIYHSERNKNIDKALTLLQIWVFPKVRDIEPRYDQRAFPIEGRVNQFQTLVSPLGSNDGAMGINQDAWFSLINLDADKQADYSVKLNNNGVYAFLIDGEAEINGKELARRDALGISETADIRIKAKTNAEILLIDVPMSF
ncbi:pirin family protein [Emticicia sp. 21SJ11W-3]|uniref:pirin family protein n=1 Tax=Emticicia sp. 21SJ11W-3 TaxID=2916755 RepID=UPI00209E7D96|nr:pirin family protein [Emticicia sp. 21SJ11W-3]UTA68775.1 pirin family protein [Emticicia sp. 21SJ11W-3]